MKTIQKKDGPLLILMQRQAIIFFLTMIVLILVFYSGYHMGSTKVQEPRVLNDWYMVEDNRLQIYRKGYVYLTRYARDSIRLDAIDSLNNL